MILSRLFLRNHIPELLFTKRVMISYGYKISINDCEYKYLCLLLFSFVTFKLIHLFFSLFLFNTPTNLLLDPDQCELSYRENFVNSIIVKVFDDIMDLIKAKT